MRTQGLGVAPACNRSLEFPQHVKPGRSCNGLRRSDLAVVFDYRIGSDLDGTTVPTRAGKLLVPIEKQYIKGHGGVMMLDPSKPAARSPVWFFPTADRPVAEWSGGVIGSVAVNDEYGGAGRYPALAAFNAIDGNLYLVSQDTLAPGTVRGPNRERGLRTFLLSSVHPEHFQLQAAVTGFSGFLERTYAGVMDKSAAIHGLLDEKIYGPVVKNAWLALVKCVAPEGKLEHVQPIGADPKNFNPSFSDVYGVGALLLAGSEVYRLALRGSLAAADQQH